MSSTLHQPHDKVFKLSMKDPLVAKEFIQTHVPPALLKKMDLTTLELENHSFVDEHYKASEADVVFSVCIDGQPAYLYILCEQQSKVDPLMALRLISYTIRLIERHTQEYPNSPLPLVYPIVIYSGSECWNAPMDIFSLFGAQEALAREWLFEPYQLVDIQRMPDDEIQKHVWSGLVEFVLKHRKIQNLEAFLRVLFSWLSEAEERNLKSGRFMGSVLLKYVFDGIESNTVQVFAHNAERYLSGKLRGEAMTLGEAFEQRGLERGMQQGMQQGKQEGEAAVIMRLIQRRFGNIPSNYAQRLKAADAETLLRWSDRILEASTIEDIFV